MAINIIEKFYTAFREHDAETMVSCYHPEIIFEDPAFGILEGKKARDMWRMLINSQKGKDFQVYFYNIELKGHKGSAFWEAKYVFNKTGRTVHNKIEANIEIRDGLIFKHKDTFDLYRWARQALGLKGILIGWTGFFQKQLQSQTNKMLTKYSASI